MQLGNLTVDQVVDGLGTFPTDIAFRNMAPEKWEEQRDLLDGEGRVPWAWAGFLVRTGDRVVLVDLALGERTLMDIPGGSFLTSLAGLGVSPDQVTDVLFTHLHGDHVGWASRNGEAVFPSATYRCSSADWQYFMVDHRGEEAPMLDPVVERFETWEGDGNLFPGVDLRLAPGHTPGSTLIVLSSGTERALLLGDAVHCPVEMVDDEWEGIADVDPVLAKKVRNDLSAELEDSSTHLGGAHFAASGFGRLVTAEGRRRWVV
jgi:glyoxylase-like metal-dependent hydrolase (beta-lactamase superfamily II)